MSEKTNRKGTPPRSFRMRALFAIGLYGFGGVAGASVAAQTPEPPKQPPQVGWMVNSPVGNVPYVMSSDDATMLKLASLEQRPWTAIVDGLSKQHRLRVIDAELSTEQDRKDATCLAMTAYIASSTGRDRLAAAQAQQRHAQEGQDLCSSAYDADGLATFGWDMATDPQRVDDRLWKEAQAIAVSIVNGSLADPEAKPRVARPLLERAKAMVLAGVMVNESDKV